MIQRSFVLKNQLLYSCSKNPAELVMSAVQCGLSNCSVEVKTVVQYALWCLPAVKHEFDIAGVSRNLSLMVFPTPRTWRFVPLKRGLH